MSVGRSKSRDGRTVGVDVHPGSTAAATISTATASAVTAAAAPLP